MTQQAPERVVNKKRLAVLIGAFALVVILAFAGLFWLNHRITTPNDEETAVEHFKVSEDDSRQLTATTRDAVSTLGTFGMSTGSLTNDSVYNVSRMMKRPDTDVSQYFTSRLTQYRSIERSEMIADDSPLSEAADDPSSWRIRQEYADMMSYVVDSIDVQVPEEGYVQQGAAHAEAVDVQVTFDSTVRKVLQTANDTSWNGDYDQMKKTFAQTKATLTFIKQGDSWKLYTIETDKPFLLASWAHPSYESMSQDMFGFTHEKTYHPSTSPQAEGKK